MIGPLRKAIVVAVGAALVASGASGAGAASSTPRQSASALFDERRPARTTGVRLAIDYVNPDDPNGKPPAVQKVVIALAPGTAVDTSVVPHCPASNPELMAQGAVACPPASRVGHGEIDLDTGIPAPARVLRYGVTILNNTGELILLLESAEQPTLRIVARTLIEGATLTTEVSPVPGGPPDGFTAIKRVRLFLDRRATGTGAARRSYVATPPSCPRGRAWVNAITFTYRDAMSETVQSASPCAGRLRSR